MLSGRLGLDSARIPHADRHGLLWLSKCTVYVADGTLRCTAAIGSELPPGDYAIPFQTVSMLLLGPGSTVSHDVLRLCASHGTGILAIGTDGIRCYSAVPHGPTNSHLLRQQVRLWSDLNGGRISVARAMYAIRFHESLPQDDINTLRGMEGVRVKDAYRELAVEWGIPWRGRHYDRQNPQGCDMANQAINHAATAVEGAAMIAVASTGTVPGLGFVHEDPGISWVLDVADLVRTTVTIPIAFQAARDVQQGSKHPIERQVRYVASRIFRDQELIAVLIDHIKSVLSCGIQS